MHQLQVVRLEERIKTLESLLKTEKILSQAQRDELIKLRAQSTRVGELEADLAAERESGKQLVQWLLEAEQELVRIHTAFNESHPQDQLGSSAP
jgi:predicted metal-binding protein